MGVSSGHLFVIDGDLTQLFCDAILIPVDRGLNVTGAWSALLRTAGFPTLDNVLPPVGWGTSVRAFQLTDRRIGPAIWLGDIGRSTPADDWYAAGLVEFVERAVQTLNHGGAVPPRVAVNVAGAGEGGGARDKGHLFTTIVPALIEVAARLHVDVVLVCWGDKPYAAAQRARHRAVALKPGSSAGLARPLHEAAERLAGHARRANLVLFLGAGVSMGAGLQSWQALISELARKADRPIEGVERLGELDVRDQAHLVSRHFNSEDAYRELLASLVKAPHYALAHGLLASLRAREAVTTNYDTLYEAAATTAERCCAVLPYEPVTDQASWLLKLHGSIQRPEGLVLTRGDYLGLPARSGALFGVLQAMLMTRHMLFVGYSLSDDTFHKVMHEVRQARAGTVGKVGTALTLFDDPLLTALWGDDLDIVSVMQLPIGARPTADDVAVAARRLDLLLDQIALLAADVSTFLLDPTYASMLDEEERQLASDLRAAASHARAGAGPVAERLNQMFRRLGG